MRHVFLCYCHLNRHKVARPPAFEHPPTGMVLNTAKEPVRDSCASDRASPALNPRFTRLRKAAADLGRSRPSKHKTPHCDVATVRKTPQMAAGYLRHRV